MKTFGLILSALLACLLAITGVIWAGGPSDPDIAANFEAADSVAEIKIDSIKEWYKLPDKAHGFVMYMVAGTVIKNFKGPFSPGGKISYATPVEDKDSTAFLKNKSDRIVFLTENMGRPSSEMEHSSVVPSERARRVLTDQDLVPFWVYEQFEENGLDQKYEIMTDKLPAYLVGDFDGNGKREFAVIIREKNSKKRGVAIEKFIVGAGQAVEAQRDGSVQKADHFNWLVKWSSSTVENSSLQDRLTGVLYLEDQFGDGAMVSWNGKFYQAQPFETGPD